MNSNAEALVIRKLEEAIWEREKYISTLQDTMWQTIFVNCVCNFLLFAAVANVPERHLSCKAWPYELLFISGTYIFLVFATMVEYLARCKRQDEDIEKLEGLKRARPGSNCVHAKGVAPWLFFAVLLVLLVLFDVFIYCGANAILTGACDHL